MNIEDIEAIRKHTEGKPESGKLLVYETYKKSEAIALLLSFLLPGLG